MLAKLISVDEEVKRLQQEVYDAEWEGDPRLVRLTEELNEWKGLQKNGVLFEPNFYKTLTRTIRRVVDIFL